MACDPKPSVPCGLEGRMTNDIPRFAAPGDPVEAVSSDRLSDVSEAPLASSFCPESRISSEEDLWRAAASIILHLKKCDHRVDPAKS